MAYRIFKNNKKKYHENVADFDEFLFCRLDKVNDMQDL